MKENAGMAASDRIKGEIFMKKRIITALVAICILIPVLLFANTVLLPIAVAICTILAVYEMLACIGLQKSVAISIPFYICAAGIPFLLRFLGNYNFALTLRICFAAATVTLLYLFGVQIFSQGRYQPSEIGMAYMGMLYIFIGFGGIVYIHDFAAGNEGRYVYLLIFIGAWVTDTFAYFSGMLFGRGGKHKLAPHVSPKKTVEGSIGGIVFCVIAMVVYGIIIKHIQSDMRVDIWFLAISGIAVSVVAQIGDLSLSVIKRHYGIKDYGFIFPGHGGILDRFDSVIAVSAVLTVLSSFTPFFERIAL